MKPVGTVLALLGLFAMTTAQAQPARTEDALWARDIGGATITFDGALTEAVWQQAEKVELEWGGFHAPGGGYDHFFGNISGTRTPADPVDATVYLLRQGNTLWIGVQARDQSVGANAADFWLWDGLALSIVNRTRRLAQPEAEVNYFGANHTDELFFSWHDRYTPGAEPRLFGQGGLADLAGFWDGRAAVTGTANDESDVDTGYTMELWLDLSLIGYDFTDSDGDRLPLTFAVYDNDFTGDLERTFLSRAWWQNPWGGDMPWGTAYVFGRPGVSVGGAAPALEAADLTLGTTTGAINVDGVLDEAAWQAVEPQLSLQYQMTASELDALPAIGPYYTSWFRSGDATVVDPSTGQFRLLFKGTRLYVGLDSDDQALSGEPGEDRADGLRLIVRSMESDTLGLPFTAYQFRVAIDSSGAARLLEDAQDNAAVRAAVHLKGGSTVADPSDIDAGYAMELEVDLASLPGYEGGLGEGLVWVSLVYFDGDHLDPVDPAQSYGTRTWFLAERGGGQGTGPGLATRLDPSFVVSTDGLAGELPTTLELHGNYPNPFNPSTRIAYALPRGGEVTVEIFDLLGRRVARLETGLQAAGRNEVRFDASGLASGLYLYRVQLEGAERLTATGRMMLLK